MQSKMTNCAAWLASATLLLCLTAVALAEDPLPAGLAPEVRKQIAHDLKQLQDKLSVVRSRRESTSPAVKDLLADADVFRKGIVWALDYESKLAPKEVAQIQASLNRGHERTDALLAGKHLWASKKGRVVRGYVSDVDGSTQPFGLIIPTSYDKEKPIRLDVVLHGSQRPRGINELQHISRFDEGDQAGKAPDVNYIELHPLGRVENCYRWAGETDVFEAIESVCRNYNIDRDRIVLRGHSMGASGTWHIGLKRPDLFVALGPYCGYVDTYEFSHTPLKNFIKVDKLPPHQDTVLHMLDSKDYAANAGVVPAIACMGDKDVFFQAHVIMEKAMNQEGLKMVNLIAKGFGHGRDPVTFKEQLRRIETYATKGLNRNPRHIRFVTWTLKYSRCHWLQVLGLEKHYARAEIEATRDGGRIEIKEPKNIDRFAIATAGFDKPVIELRVGGVEVDLPDATNRKRPWVIGKRNGRWRFLGSPNELKEKRKRPGLQGPIDDAFAAPFLCVRGTGKAWHPSIAAWSKANLSRFAHEWRKYFRGELPIKDDTQVTEADVARCNLILFGDPASNTWIAKVLPQLPIQWTRDELVVGDGQFSSQQHAPVLIYPSPLPEASNKYVVLNSGHTFHEKELSSLNYLLFPRHGDWAVMKLGEKSSTIPPFQVDEEVLSVGFFDERWRLPRASQK